MTHYSEEIGDLLEKRRDYFIDMYKNSEVYMEKVLALSELYFMYQTNIDVQFELVDMIRKLANDYTKAIK